MSKIVKAVCTIREVNPDIFKEAMKVYAKHNNAQLTWINKNKVRVSSDNYINGMYATIELKDNQINVTGESYSSKKNREIIEQYYAAADIALEYGVEPEMNEQGELLLNLEVE